MAEVMTFMVDTSVSPSLLTLDSGVLGWYSGQGLLKLISENINKISIQNKTVRRHYYIGSSYLQRFDKERKNIQSFYKFLTVFVSEFTIIKPYLHFEYIYCE